MLTPANPRNSHDEHLTPEETHYRGSTALGIGVVFLVLGLVAAFASASLGVFLFIVGAVIAAYGALARATSRDRSSSGR